MSQILERPPRPLRRILVAGGLAVAATLLLLEGALRLLLFVDVPGLERISGRLRQPHGFFTPDEPGFWTTSVRFTPRERLRPVPGFDARLGWRGHGIEAGTYAHAEEPRIHARRPILLYGDSFAACTTKAKDCWQGLLQRSELGRTHVLLNYGVGGYGLDQALLLMEASVDRFLDRDPIVIVGILVDDDLDRTVLPFRAWPKPLFCVAGGALVEPEPVEGDFDTALDDLSPRVWSWAWRYVTHAGRAGRSDATSPRTRPAIEELSRLLLARVQTQLDARGVDWFVLLFQGSSLLRGAPPWEHAFLVDTLRELGIPFVSVRRELLAHAARPGAGVEALFELEGRAKNHYTPLGNEVVFPAILRGIRGELD